MYFLWGYGTFRLTGSEIPLFLGAFFAAWNIYPRFCGVEVLLERLDKAPWVYQKEPFKRALAGAFVTSAQRGKADYWLTVLVHPASIDYAGVLDRDLCAENISVPGRS